MKRSMEELRELFESVPGNIVIYRFSEGKMQTLFCSPGVPAISGLSREEYKEIVKNDASDILLPNDRDLFAKHAAGLLSGSRDEMDCTFRICHKTYGFVWVHAMAKKVGELAGDPILLASFLNTSREAEMPSVLLDHDTRKIYVVDKRSYDLLYANARALADGKYADYSNMPCHKFVRGRGEPCPGCPIRQFRERDSISIEWQDPDNDKYYQIDAFSVSWYGRAAYVFINDDITDRRKAQISLEQEKDSLENTLRHIPAGLCVYRLANGNVHRIAASPYYCGMMQMSEREALDEDLADFIGRVHPDERSNFAKDFETLAHGGRPAPSVCRFRCGEAGKWRWLCFDGNAVPQTDGTSLLYVCCTDITAQRSGEESYSFFMNELLTLDPGTLGTYRLDLSRDICCQDRRLEADALGLSCAGQAELFLRCLSQLAADRDAREEFSARFSRERLLLGFLSGCRDESCNFQRVTPDGERRRTEVHFRMARNPRTGGIEAIIRVTDDNEAAKEEAILQHIVNEEFDSIAIIDTLLRSIRFRNLGEGAVGTTPNKYSDYDTDIRYAFSIVAAPEDYEDCIGAISLGRVMQELQTQKSYEYAFSMHDKEGRWYRKLLKYGYIDDSRREILLSRTDITRDFMLQREHMNKLQAALTEARSADAAKTEFLSRVSHDIRTPMNIIKGMTEFAYQDAADPEKLRHDLDRISAANTFLLSLINDVLDISRIDSGKIELHLQPYPYREFTGNIRAIMEPLCRANGINFRMSCMEGSHTIIVDKVRLNQILLNLLTNAAKYTPAGGLVEFESGAAPEGPDSLRCFFVVRDTGLGMSEEFQKRMFEPFTQENSAPSSLTTGGSGLGLAIVKRLVALLGGEIAVKSAPGRGTEFTVSFCFRCFSDDEEQEAEAATASAGRLCGRVLLAEDNEINAEIAQRLLESFGLSVVTARNGAEALELFKSSAPDSIAAVLMDIQMPVMDGYEAAKSLRALARPDAACVPIIAMTANAYSEDVKKCFAAGMNGHVAKPVDADKLYDELARAAGTRKEEH